MPKSKKKVKKYHIELTSVSVFWWGVFLFFLLTWMFVLGILMGRGFLPGSISTISDLRSQIKKLQDMVSREERFDSRVTEELDESPELVFYEKLATKKNEVKNNWKQEKEKDITKKKEVTSEAVKLHVEPDDTREPDIFETEKDESSLSDSDFQYTIQLFSFDNKDKTERLTKELKDQGYDAYYYAVEIKGKTFYRLRCGRFPDRDQALIYLKKLETESGYKGFVSKID